jgi:hypothetical protein
MEKEPKGEWVMTEDFVRLTKMDPTQFYLLFVDKKLPIAKIGNHFYVDIDDVRARQYLPDYKPMKDLFA